MVRRTGGAYLDAFLVALLPIPFTTVRLTLLRVRPRLAPYALTVAGARLPRYLVTVLLWRSLAPPGWVAGLLVLAGVGYMLLAGQRPARELTAPPPPRSPL